MPEKPANTDPAPGTDPAAGTDPSNLPEGAPSTGPAGDLDDDEDEDDDGDPAGGAAGDGATKDPTAKARKQAAAARVRAREAETARQAAEAAAEAATKQAADLQKVLDVFRTALDPDAPKDEPLDPKALAEQLAAEKAARESETTSHAEQIRKLTVAAALPRAFAQHDADPDLTEAVLEKTGALAALDPTSKTFVANLAAAVKAAVDKNPKLKVTAPPTRSGTEPTGAAGGSTQLTRADLANMSSDEIKAAQAAGRLNNILAG